MLCAPFTFGTQSFLMLPSWGILAQTQPSGAPSGSPNSYLRSFTLTTETCKSLMASSSTYWIISFG